MEIHVPFYSHQIYMRPTFEKASHTELLYHIKDITWTPHNNITVLKHLNSFAT